MNGSSSRAFNFVNLKHPDDLKDEGVQSEIRRLAMTEVGKARRKPKTRRERNQIVLQLRDPPFPMDRFAAGEIDPFAQYPIDMDHSSLALLANIFSDNSHHATQLRGSWWPVGLSCAAAFHNMLANSQNFIFMKMNGEFPSQDHELALTHHYKSLLSAKTAMEDTNFHNTDEAISTVLSFLAHHTLLGNFTTDEWANHRAALMKLVILRGGISQIITPHLRIAISWCDLLLSFALDIPSVIPPPPTWTDLIPHTLETQNPISLAWRHRFPYYTAWISTFDSLVSLISTHRTAFTPQTLLAASHMGTWLEPTLVTLLKMRPLSPQDTLTTTPAAIIEEVARLGTLLFLAPCWRYLGHRPVHTRAICRKLRSVLARYTVSWYELTPVLLWVLFFAVAEEARAQTREKAENEGGFAGMLEVLTHNWEWVEVLSVVKSVLWVADVCEGFEDVVRGAVVRSEGLTG